MNQIHTEQTGWSEFGSWALIAQAPPPLAGGKGEALPATTAASATGETGTATQAPAGGPTGGPPGGGPAPAPMGGFGMIWMIMLVFVIMIGFSWWGQSKERKKRAAMLSAIGRSDRVQTAGGIIGTVVEMRDDEVVLRVDESTNTKITFAKHAIQGVVKKAHSNEVAAAAA
ncbi:MAG: preprotein translocase subunit YajC [Phycisphaerales bacterium]